MINPHIKGCILTFICWYGAGATKLYSISYDGIAFPVREAFTFLQHPRSSWTCFQINRDK